MPQSEIIARIETFLELDGSSPHSFARLAGIDPGNLTKMMAGKQKITDNTIRKISNAHSINFEWLKYGEGKMLVENEPLPELSYTGMRPRIPVNASAGFLSDIAQGVTVADCELMPVIPGVPDYVCTIMVRGDSMEPRYESGDELAITPVRDRKFLQWGHVYIIDTLDGVLLKRIYDDGESIRCVSYNPEYPDSHIDKSSINSIWRVVALLRRF